MFLARAIALAMTCGGLSVVRGQDLAIEVAAFPGLGEASRVVAIAETADARLWCGFRNRVQWHDARGVFDLTWHGEAEAMAGPGTVRCLAAGADDRLWIGTSHGVWTVPAGGTVARRVAGIGDTNTWSIAVDPAGRAFCQTSSGVFVCASDGAAVPVPPPGAGRGPDHDPLYGVAAAGPRVYLRSQSGLWQADATEESVRWRPVPEAPANVRLVVEDAGWPVAVGASGVHRLQPDGSWRPLWLGSELAAASHAARCAGVWWFASLGHVWRLGDTGELRSVRLFERGEPYPIHLGIHALVADRQDLLWFGTQTGMHRAGIVAGIEHVLVEPMEDGHAVAALAEVRDGSIVLGQANGALLRQTASGWQHVDVPWAGSAPARRRVECLGVDAAGTLWVGTRAAGVWTWDGTSWQQIGVQDGVDGARSWVEAGDGAVWLAGTSNVWRRDPGRERFTAVPIARPQTAIDPRPSVIVEDAGREVWLGTYRGGVFRLDRAADSFARHPSAAFDGAVVALLADPHQPGRLWASSTEGLLLLDTAKSQVATLRTRSSSGIARGAASIGNGSIWLAFPGELVHFDADTRYSHTLSPRLGAHPTGYSYRAQANRRSGEILLGARGGFTSISPRTDVAARWPVLAGGFEVAAGADLARCDGSPASVATVEAGGGPVAIRPALIDRTSDAPPPVEVLLLEPSSERLHRSRTGRFEALAAGTYEVTLLVARATGATEAIASGHLRIRAPVRTWLFWAAVLALGSASLAWFVRGRGARRRNHRRVVVEQILTRAGRRPEQTLDIAFLAVATAEDCARLTSARHTSIWIRDEVDARRVLLAEFGDPCPDAESRADCCCAGGSSQDALRVLAVQGGTDVLVRIRELGDLQFEVLLHAPARCDDAVLQAVRDATLPVLTAIRKLRWLDRLEAEHSEASAALAADLHDLRNPLTTLRICLHEMQRHAGASDPRLAELTQLVVGAGDQIAATVDGIARQRQRARAAACLPEVPAVLVAERVKAMTPLAEHKSIRLVFQDCSGGVSSMLDALWFNRVVDNIVGNAIKYSPPSGVVEVTCEARGDGFHLHVDDDGPGFLAGEVDAVFLPGVVGAAQPTAGETQTGMGLWIARQAMRAMGGDLRIEARQGRTGARVSLHLPVCDAGASGAAVAPPPAT